MADRAGLRARVSRLPALLTAATATSLALAWALTRTGDDGASGVPGIADAGSLTAWGLPVARAAADAGAVATVGALLLVAVLLPGGHRLTPAQLPYLNWAGCAAASWAVASVAAALFTLSDLFAEPVGALLDPAILADFVITDVQGRSYALTTAAASVLATVCWGIGTARWARTALVVAVAGLLPPAFAGHSAASGNHDSAVLALALHLVGAAVWVGGLAFVLIAAVREEPDSAVALRRLGALAGWSLLAVAASGIVSAVVRLPAPGDLFTSRYGLLVLAKGVALAVLAGIGHWHRRRTLPAFADGRRRAFVRLAAGELLVMAAAVGLAVGLSRTAVPGVGDAALTPAEELLGFPLPPALGGFPWTPLFTQWHFDPLFGFGGAAAALAYLAGVRTLRARGDAWPVGRTVAWLLGLTVTVLATMSGLAVYGKVMMSVHMGQHMVLAMTVPILLVLGAPVTLALRVLPPAPRGSPGGPRELLLKLLHSRFVAVLSHPVVASVLFIASAFAVYYTSLFETLMRSHLGHMVMLVHFLATGLLFFWVIIGIDPGPRRPPHLGRLFALMLVMPFHSWFSISLMSSTAVIGEGWWEALGRTWGPSLLDDQYNGGAIAWATGDLPVLLTTVVLAIQWTRSDAREARRVDRKIDRGDADDPLAAYNAYLAALHARDRARSSPPATASASASDVPVSGTPYTPEES